MGKTGKFILWFFAFIGVLSSIGSVYDFFRRQSVATAYGENCLNIRTGMSLLEAKKIMGDDRWFEKSSRSEVWIENIEMDSMRRYYLSYPAVVAASEWPMIYFDPVTMKVTKVVCSK